MSELFCVCSVGTIIDRYSIPITHKDDVPRLPNDVIEAIECVCGTADELGQRLPVILQLGACEDPRRSTGGGIKPIRGDTAIPRHRHAQLTRGGRTTPDNRLDTIGMTRIPFPV